MTCYYCGRDIEPLEKGVYRRGKYYHVECNIAWTHDLAKVIQLKAKDIVDCAHNHNAKARILARQIIKLAERLQ